MGFDNECILNIQSLAGEYFCPVCRTLVYPHEALQAQCTHLYCKPCLTYVVSSTQACPYDGYLVTEAGSKPLMESNKALAETIGKTTVHCLYHRSGCVWQGPLSECTSHCSGCTFGNSPVVCNRCGIQIVHRQVQEHAQSCNVNGTNSQPQQGTQTALDAAASGVAVSTDQSKISNQTAASASQPLASNTVIGPSAAPVQNLNQPAISNPVPQAMAATAVPTPDQQYYQQYQQYYQQYPGYDPYQQQAYQQQYYPYQQQPAQQFQQPPLQVQGQPQPQPQPQSQPQLQQQVQAPVQVQPQALAQSQGQPLPQQQIPANGQPQPMYPQVAMVGPSQNQGQVIPQQVQPQNQPSVAHGHIPAQSYSQVQPHPVQTQAQPPMQMPQYQQPHPQMHHPQQPLQMQSQSHPHFLPHPQPQPQPQPQSQPINLQHPPVQPVAGQPPYPSQPHQHAPPQQHPMQVPPSGSLPPGQMPAQFPPPPPHMRPSQPPHMLPSQGQAPGIPPTQHIHSHNQTAHQRPAMHQAQQPVPPQYSQQPQGPLHHAGSFAQQYPQVRPQGPPPPMQQPPLGFVQPQQGNALPPSMPPQSHVGRPILNQGGQLQQFSQSSGAAGIAPQARPPQFGSTQPSINQSNVYSEQQLNQYAPPPVGGAMVDKKGDQMFERRVGQEEGKSASVKKSESMSNDFGANYNEVKSEVGVSGERRPGNGVEDGKNEALTKDAVSEPHQVHGVPGDSVTTQRVKEESKEGDIDQSPGGKLGPNKAQDGGAATIDSIKQGEASINFQGSHVDNGNSQGPQGQIGDVSGGFSSKGTEQSSHPASLTEQGRSPHPLPVPYGQQQRPAAPGQPPSHLKPTGHDYLPHGSHPGQALNVGDHFPPPGSFHSEVPFGGPPNSFTNNSSRGHEPQSARFSRMSQGEPFGPAFSSALLPHGPDGPTVPRHPGPVESDMYQNQRPPHYEGRRPDSYLPGNVDRGPYGQPFGVESNSTRLNGALPPPGLDEKFRTLDTYPIAPTNHHEQGEFKGTLKQFPGPPHFGREDSPKFGSHSSRPLGGYGMDGPSRFLDKDHHGSHAYGGYDAGQRLDPGPGGPPSGFLPPPYHSAGGLHLNESGGRPLPPSMHDDNRGRFDHNRQNPDFLGPRHGYGRHHMDRLPPNSPSRPFGGPHIIDVDGRDMERHPFGERFPLGPPGHMHRGDFDGPGKPRGGEPFGMRNHLPGRGEPGFGSFHDCGRSGESHGHGPGAFSHQPPFGESFGPKSTRPQFGEPGFRSSYSRKGFPSDTGYFAGGSDSYDHSRKRKPISMGWCRICKVDCESVEGLDMHGQTRDHQRMAMDMVISIKQKNAKKHKISNDHSSHEEASKLRNAEIHARANMS